MRDQALTVILVWVVSRGDAKVERFLSASPRLRVKLLSAIPNPSLPETPECPTPVHPHTRKPHPPARASARRRPRSGSGAPAIEASLLISRHSGPQLHLPDGLGHHPRRVVAGGLLNHRLRPRPHRRRDHLFLRHPHPHPVETASTVSWATRAARFRYPYYR